MAATSAHAFELLDGIENHGLYCMIARDTMLLLHAYAKRSQKAPRKELETARHRLFDAQRRGV